MKLKKAEFFRQLNMYEKSVSVRHSVTFEQTLVDFKKGIYRVLATLYIVNSIGSREPIFYSIYKEKI